MAKTRSPRENQRRRTRKDLLQAAAALLRDGREPSVAEVAEAALVSRATAYRYFPTKELLLAEAPLDRAVPTGDGLFADDASTDPVERVDRAEAALHKMVFENETQLRVMLACSLDGRNREEGVPHRQNRRTELIEAALAPVRARLDKATYDTLCASLALVFGTESMVVFRDVLQVGAGRARKVKSWAVKTLVGAALDQSLRTSSSSSQRRLATKTHRRRPTQSVTAR
jgi:AcrR family transcriptional regulator